MEKRLILAIALSILVIVTFQSLFGRPTGLSRQSAVTEKTEVTVPGKETVITPLPSSKIPPAEKTAELETKKYYLTLSDVGGSIKAIRLKDYKNPNSDEPLDLAQIDNPQEYILAMTSPFTVSGLDLLPYEIEKSGGIISYTSRLDDFEIRKEYILHNSKHIIELRVLIKNISDQPKGFNYRIIGGAGIVETNPQDRRFVEVTSKINGKIVNFKRPRSGRIINLGAVDWAALKSKYFSIILKPFTVTKGQFYSADRDNHLVMGVDVDAGVIQPGSFTENKFLLYAGPADISILKESGYGLDETVNYGFFGGIAKVLIYFMRISYSVAHNWGLAIILLSIFLNIILFPLTLKSFKSMRKMQELHPQMEKLKTQYKDNPQKLNKEVLELYKKYNINPLSGCLPMLFQMPIFIALYQAMMKSIELRSSGFLWIKDLSLPDAVPLPFSMPIAGNKINILPLLMVILMVFQQKISSKAMGGAVTEEQKQQQQMMLILMPVMFGFIFYNMPSGLVLYWVVNTILTIIEQAAVFKSE